VDRRGTPTSTTTSLSELSTVAIKDGHRGHMLHNHHNPMDAERADRISRLAGFDRMAQPQRGLAPGTAGGGGGGLGVGMHSAAQMMARERSTVGSASATTASGGGAAGGGGRAAWGSGGSEDTYDALTDRMSVSEDMDVDAASSVGGFSDEGAPSLVGFGEGARTPARQVGGSVGSPSVGGSVAVAGKTPQQQLAAGLRQAQAHSAAAAGASPSPPAVEAQRQDSRLIDGMTYDADVVDTANRTPPPVDD
jgi:hypothetical protein